MNNFHHACSLLVLLVTLLLPASAKAQSVAALFDQLAPSVVSIHAREWIIHSSGKNEIHTVSTQGTGVLVSADGKVLTAAHLVQTADEIQVELDDGKTTKAWIIASEPAADMALLQLKDPPSGKPHARLGDSDKASIGEGVFIIGSPYDMHPILSVGYLAGRSKPASPFGRFEPLEMFQTDAVVHQGSSGSPLFNLQGEVIGVVTRVMTTHGQAQGMGFSIPSNIARTLLLERRSFWTGIGGYWLSGDLALALNLTQPSGLLVQRIASHSPASCLKLQAGSAPSQVGLEEFVLGGDIILSVQGISLADEKGYQKVRDALATIQEGELLSMKVLRAGKQIELASASCSGRNQRQ